MQYFGSHGPMGQPALHRLYSYPFIRHHLNEFIFSPLNIGILFKLRFWEKICYIDLGILYIWNLNVHMDNEGFSILHTASCMKYFSLYFHMDGWYRKRCAIATITIA